jgi:hypothetical protein
MGVKLGLLTLRDEHRLRVFENRVLRRIFGPKRVEVPSNCGRFGHLRLIIYRGIKLTEKLCCVEL